MKEIVNEVHIVCKDESELSESEHELLKEAQAATWRSYAPYSNFSVGAAVRLSDGSIVTGNNQENCAFPSGLCAERTALFYANSRYPDFAVEAICIAARGLDGEFTRVPISPCGGCRQVMLEVEHRFGRPLKVMMYGTDGVYILQSARDLLPVGFEELV